MKIAFNCSLPRSGSTLLQNILAQNPRFHCTPTSGLCDLLGAARDTFSRIPEVMAQDREEMRKAFLGYCAGAMQGYFSPITGKEVVIDKSRGWVKEYAWLNQFHPSPKIIVPVRDLRAILSSMEKRYHRYPHLSSGELGIDPTGMKMATVTARVTYWLNSAPVGSNVMRLLGAAERGLLPKLHIVRYEDLTSRPQKILDGIYDYLEEPRFTHDFQNVQQLTHENDSFYPVYGDHAIRQEVKPVPLDYEQTLGKALCQTIREDNAAFYNLFYPNR